MTDSSVRAAGADAAGIGTGRQRAPSNSHVSASGMLDALDPPKRTTRWIAASYTNAADDRAGGAAPFARAHRLPLNCQVSPSAPFIPRPPNSTTRLRDGSYTIDASARGGGVGEVVTSDQCRPSNVHVA